MASSASAPPRRRNSPTRGVAGWPPRWLTATTLAERRRGDGAGVCDFIGEYCRVTKDSFAGRTGTLLRLRPWQHELTGALFARRAGGRRRHRQALVGLPRKNGKSGLGSGFALYGLLCEVDGAEVYSCAADKEQARIVFGMAKRMVELDPELADMVKVYKDVLEVVATGSIYRALSSEAFTKEGLSPTLVMFDEVHAQPNRELWDVMALAMGGRVEPLMVGITTAGSRTDSLGADTLCYGLYQHGRKVATGELDDPSFFFAWWEPRRGADCNHRDPKVWAESNPGLGDLVDEEDFASVVNRTPESEFRTKRTNVWVVSASGALPHGAWDRCKDTKRTLATITPADDAVLFVDGSWNGDCTAIVGSTWDGHLFTVDVWERDLTDPHWRVPISDVKARIVEVALELGARIVAFDPYRWQAVMVELEEEEGLPVIDWPTGSLGRIVPAWKSFYDDVVDKALTHDGDPRLARHIENMRLKIDRHGARPVKEHGASGRHIDLGICAVGAYAIRQADDDPDVDVADNVW